MYIWSQDNLGFLVDMPAHNKVSEETYFYYWKERERS